MPSLAVSSEGLLTGAALLLAGVLWADASVLCFHGSSLGHLRYLRVWCFVMGGGIAFVFFPPLS